MKAYENAANPAHYVVRIFEKYMGLQPSIV